MKKTNLCNTLKLVLWLVKRDVTEQPDQPYCIPLFKGFSSKGQAVAAQVYWRQSLKRPSVS